MLIAAITTTNCTMVAIVDSTAPATAPAKMAGVLAARADIAPMAALLETKPAASPATGRPKRTPRVRMAT